MYRIDKLGITNNSNMKKLIFIFSVLTFFSCEEKKYEVPKEFKESEKMKTEKKIDSIDQSMKRSEKIFDNLKKFKLSGMSDAESEQALQRVNADDYDFYINHLKGE